MNYSLHYLAHLVQTKNDLNRKRRRFHSIFNPRWRVRGSEYIKSRKIYHDDPSYASKMYRQTQEEMKAMTPHMKEVRKELGVQFIWSKGGAISCFRTKDKLFYLEEVEALAKNYRADSILLGD